MTDKDEINSRDDKAVTAGPKIVPVQVGFTADIWFLSGTTHKKITTTVGSPDELITYPGFTTIVVGRDCHGNPEYSMLPNHLVKEIDLTPVYEYREEVEGVPEDE